MDFSALSGSTFSAHINQIDYTICPPGPLDNSALPRVPVIRIYGTSSAGEKACVHIHQVYPYFFIEYTKEMTPENVNRYITKLSVSLDHAIALSLKRNPGFQYVRAITLVKGVHFYGFHSSYSPFLKIHLIDPALTNRAVTLLQTGTIMRTKFHVFESHLSYLLQFMCDFGLYGCGWINLGEVWERSPEIQEPPPSERLYSFKFSPYYRQSRMPVEVDAVAHQILNRHQLQARNVHNGLNITALPLPSEPVVLSVRELWEDERRRRISKGLSPTPKLPIDTGKIPRGGGGDWVAEARWWEELRRKIELEKQDGSFMSEGHSGWERWVMTTFESVEVLWEPRWKVWKPSKGDVGTAEDGISHPMEGTHNPFAQASQGTPSSLTGKSEEAEVDVDVVILSSQDIDLTTARNEGEDGENDDTEDVIDSGEHEELEDSSRNLPFEGEVVSDEAPRGSGNNDHTMGTPNRFSNVWNRLSREKRPRSTSELRSEPATPRKVRRLSQQLTTHDIVTRSASPDFAPDIERLEADNPFLITNGDQTLLPPVKNSAHSDWVGRRPGIHGTSNARIPRASYGSSRGLQTYHLTSRSNGYVYANSPPRVADLFSTIEDHGFPWKLYSDPFYSNRDDVPDRPWEYGGLVYNLKGGGGIDSLEEWKTSESFPALTFAGKASANRVGGWEYASCAPTCRQIKVWLKGHPLLQGKKAKMQSQIEGRTQANLFGLNSDPKISACNNTRRGQHMTLLSVEVFAPSRGNCLPDANVDGIAALFYAFGSDDPSSGLLRQGIFVLESDQTNVQRLGAFSIESFASELDLINRLIDVVIDLDPDILLGWEVQAASWGYLNARGNHYGFDLAELISRAPSRESGNDNQRWDQRSTTTFKVVGRHVLNVWRIMRSERNLNVYTFENVAFHVLRRRFPRYTPYTLTEWFNSPVPAHTSRVLRYFADRTSMNLDILEETEVITKTAEFARVFGVDFYSVISRGSQFKVESFMFRIAKPECFVLLSPSKQDVGKQNAAECVPLIMEPLSGYYNGPLVVLDFQSLYPSVMIAYNYCYSTCLGRITDFQNRNKLGVTDLHRPIGLLEKLQDHVAIAPNGIIYVKPAVRQGLLGRMLTELLDTRVMVKQAMKSVKDDKVLRRTLDARQLGLKYIANVTYGYTSASYSGRMPAVQIADSIVQSGREILEKAINVIDSTDKWGARVVYGDTDSLFIYLKGKTKEQAFRIGQDIADTITVMNPAPIKLKFEKVYLPSVLLAKKRYVGFSFETLDVKTPSFDAKGIETIRRDGVAAQSKMTEACLKILFRTQDLSLVKQYCCRTWSKILRNKVSFQDFIFAKEVRMGTYSERGPPPPGVAVAARRMLHDPNDEPQYGERVPYIIARGSPHSRLIERAVTPEEILANPHLQIDAVYYIEKVLIPPLERIFNLVGVDVRAWYEEMPKAIEVDQRDPLASSPKKLKTFTTSRLNIDEHFSSTRCLACNCPAFAEGICEDCQNNSQEAIPNLLRRLHKGERRLLDTHKVCATCTANALAEPIECVNIDCPWLYERNKAERKVDFLEGLQAVVEDLDFTDNEDIHCTEFSL
ncbi:hypothetical protein M404DRAFT_22870 [Pisolithus tinctorius Marx 270]|uniref:DNA polymerase n=1 Tax=Pisolithus tinctorius Marx 270 TaxID=870435 RepID=A0A0C3P5A4_PISTI|nr:hypothetical protein M404DRAFT_22870 [Pisolithus tinctorius Marx 270]